MENVRLTGLVILQYIAVTIALECPSDWETHGDSCYKFVWYPFKDYPDAELACSSLASALVSIDDLAEHTFVSGVLDKADSQRYTWYTSGMIQTKSLEDSTGATTSDQIVWEGDGTHLHSSITHLWQPRRAKDGDFLGKIVVYKYANYPATGYVFGRSVANVKRPYICEIPLAEVYRIYEQRRGYEYGIAVDDLNEIPRGPNITEQPRDLVILSTTDSVHVECAASGTPMPTYKWFHHSVKGKVEITSSSHKRYLLTGGRLTITNPSEENDTGTFHCQAENRLGTVLSDPVSITFGELRQFSNVRRETVNVHEYKGGLIECSPPHHRPGVSYQWFKNSPENFVRPEHQTYIFISDNGKLYFSEVTKVDEGNYHCVVTLGGPYDRLKTTNFEGKMQSPSRTSLPIPLFVLDSGQTSWGPQIQDDFVQIMPQTPLRGQDVRLECFAYGTAPIFYSWSRDNNTMPAKTKYLDSARVIILPDVQFEDTGNYRCTARRTLSAVDEKAVNLKIAAKPYFDYPLRNQHLDIGGELTWRCAARAAPTATYSWYKNGVPVVNQPGVIEVNSFILKILQLDPARDNGTYQCAAQNIYGTTYTSAEIRVLSFKPSFSKNPLDATMRAAIGGNATLVCQPEAAPFPTFTWSKNGADIGATIEPTARVRLLGNGNLFISPVQASDAGLYTCTATNDLGTDSSAGQLEVIEGIVINSAPRPRTVHLNETEFLSCRASHSPDTDMIYSWLFNGKLLDIDHNPYFGRGAYDGSGGLYIRNAQFEHDGVFTCVARTVHEKASAEARITIIGPPGPPAGVFVQSGSITPISMEIRWTPGDDHGQPILSYIIEIYPLFNQTWRVAAFGIEDGLTVVEDEDKRRHVLKNLKPGNSYRFRIIAVNEFGVGEASEPSLQYTTDMGPPTVAPNDLGGGEGKVGTLKMTWTPLHAEDLNGEGIGYNVYWRKQGGQETDWTKNVELGQANTSVASVGTVNFYLPYDVKIQAFNSLGAGPNTSIVTIYSAEDLPMGQVVNVGVEGYNETTMLVTWDIPDGLTERNSVKGVIRGFQINCWIGSRWQPGSRTIPNTWRRRAYAGPEDTQVLVVGALNGIYYFCDVQVRNSAGLGPESDSMSYSSNDLAPTRYPTEVSLHSNGWGSIKIIYRGVTTSEKFVGEEPLDGYRVRHWQAGDDIRTAVVTECGRNSWCIVNGLEMNMVYNMRVYGYSGGGDGKMSPTMSFTMGGQARIDQERYDLLAEASVSAPGTLILLLSCFLHMWCV